ncbi:MAG: cytochrome C [bacterium]
MTSAHSHLEGLSNCTKCHEIGEKVINSKCLACHTEIKSRIDAGRGYHANSTVKNKNCVGCHNEHHGRNFKIIHFDKKKFNHAQTGFNLTGKHSEIECKNCHDPKFITDAKLKKKKSTYLGMTTECSNCHEDVHGNTLGSKCGKCHSNNSFKPAGLFEHSSTKFLLTGKHTAISCTGCHKNYNDNKKKIVFNISSFSNCSDCHKDVHQGKFGANCKDCHVAETFQRIINLDKIDHSKTRFPLVGKHRGVDCKRCHISGLSYKPKFGKCINCHEDYHKGRFKEINKVRDCSECHTEQSFSPSQFKMNDHNELEFKLTGSHLAVSCQSCHFKNSVWNFKLNFEKCTVCHNNVHGSSISEKFLKDENCSSCHQTDSWEKINFNHGATNFELSGKHSAVSCKNCHLKNDSSGNFVQVFRGLDKNCENCHPDKHVSQFAVDGKTDCSRCHAFENWKADKFDHAKTRFPLTGSHSITECLKCHKQKVNEKGQYTQYKFDEIKCAICHS